MPQDELKNLHTLQAKCGFCPLQPLLQANGQKGLQNILYLQDRLLIQWVFSGRYGSEREHLPLQQKLGCFVVVVVVVVCLFFVVVVVFKLEDLL